MTPFPRFALRTLPALFLSLGCLAATVQAAEAVRYRFSQAAAPLAQALNAFSRASGQTLLYTAELPPQAMRQLPAQITDVVTSLASGMPVWM
ncbi:phage tail length tape measure family protein, partial [Pseudomonas aeruginosa]|uniref:phage tail length tape measure family protein n=1 Tax=Pseudomonas aeruginosa TaxID=287 RepID=UPI0019D5D88D